MPTGRADVLHFVRPNGWHCVTNFGTELYALPDGVVRVASKSVEDGQLAGQSTVWITNWPSS